VGKAGDIRNQYPLSQQNSPFLLSLSFITTLRIGFLAAESDRLECPVQRSKFKKKLVLVEKMQKYFLLL
jgi:hypothetical protein